MAPRRWKKSQRSGNRGECVEIAASTRGIVTRDSKQADTSAVLNVRAAALRDVLREER